jgi:hypothetical protein
MLGHILCFRDGASRPVLSCGSGDHHRIFLVYWVVSSVFYRLFCTNLEYVTTCVSNSYIPALCIFLVRPLNKSYKAVLKIEFYMINSKLEHLRSWKKLIIKQPMMYYSLNIYFLKIHRPYSFNIRIHIFVVTPLLPFCY